MWIYFEMQFIPVMQSWIFSIITPVFSFTWSSEIILICWFAAQETFLIIINVENSCAAEYSRGSMMKLKFQAFHIKFKRTEFIQFIFYLFLQCKKQVKKKKKVCQFRSDQLKKKFYNKSAKKLRNAALNIFYYIYIYIFLSFCFYIKKMKQKYK